MGREHRCAGDAAPPHEVTPCVCLMCSHRQFPSLIVSKQCRDQIQPKMLTKQIFRLMEKFNIDQGVRSADHV